MRPENNRERNNWIARRKIIARGLTAGLQRRIVVSFDDETFSEISAEAIRRERSFAFVVRELVELGLETAKQ